LFAGKNFGIKNAHSLHPTADLFFAPREAARRCARNYGANKMNAPTERPRRTRKKERAVERGRDHKRPDVAAAASRTPSAILDLNQQHIAAAALAAEPGDARDGIAARVRGPRGPPQNDDERDRTRKKGFTSASAQYDPLRRRQNVAAARERARVTVRVGELPRILRIAEIETITSLRRSTIYELMQEPGGFPLPIPLSPRAVGWVEQEVREWVQRQIAARDKKTKELATA
jgi:prophage regulatory protein